MSLKLNSYLERSERPPTLASPGRRAQALFTLLLLFGFSGGLLAQTTCFAGLTAGPDASYCAGESATLDGGYGSYTGDATAGNPEVTWSIVEGAGQFSIDGTLQGITASATNFAYSGNGSTGPVVTFTPDAGVTDVTLRITATTDEEGCNTNEEEDVTLYFDPVNNVPIDAILEGSTVFDNGDETTTNAIVAETGDVLTLVIDETIVIDNGQQNEDIPLFNVSYAGAGGFFGLPAAGDYDQGVFDNTFDDLVLTSNSCDPATITMSVFTYYDRDGNGALSGAEECPGPVTNISITVNPRPDVVATLGFDVGEDVTEAVVCADNDMIQVVVTGTPNTTISYTLDYGSGPGAVQTLDLDATGVNQTDILLDANAIVSGDEILVVLVGGEYQSGPPCPQVFSKPLTITVEPLPTLMLGYIDPADEVQCFGTTFFPFEVTTTSGPGTYTFDIDVFFDGVEVPFNGGTGPDFGSFTTVISGSGSSLLSATLQTFGSNGTLEIRLNGASITKDGLNGLECTNPAPDASLSFLLQADSFVEYEATVDAGTPNAGPTQSLTEDNTSLDLVVCDGQSIDFDQIAPAADNSVIAGITGALEIGITDPDNLLGFGTSATLYRDFDANPFEFDQIFDIPNSQATSSTIQVTATPYFEEDGVQGLTEGDECSGDPVVLNIEVRPAPTVTVVISEPVVCEDETVTVTITASEPGTATLIINGGGQPIVLDVTGPDGGPFTHVYTSAELTEMTQFTVTTFVGDVAGCEATVNQMVMVDVELNPDAGIEVGDDALCLGDETTVTLTGSGGAENGYTFETIVSFAAPSGGGAFGDETTFTTEPGESTVVLSASDLAEVLFGVGGEVIAGTYAVAIESVANVGGLECSTVIENETVTFTVEEDPELTCEASSAEPICSGDDYSFTFTAVSGDPSGVTGDELFYSVVVSTTEFNNANNLFETTDSAPVIIAASDAAPQIEGTGLNMSGFNQTITATATPFYFDTDGGTVAPTEIGDNCDGDPVSCSITVRTMPMATFGGDFAICEGVEFPGLIITGPPNGAAFFTFAFPDGTESDALRIDFDAGGFASFTLANPFPGVVLRLTFVTDEFGCTNPDDFDFPIEVIPTPEATFDEDEDTICEGDETAVGITGTAGATVSISDGTTTTTVELDQSGLGTFNTGTLFETTTFTITQISFGVNADDEPCVSEEEDTFVVTVNPAPVGALNSNAVLCDGDSPEVQFNLTTEGVVLSGTFDIVVNGILFEDVINGEVLDFAGTAFATLSPGMTLFNLESIVESDTDLECADVIDGVIFSEPVMVNEVPVVTISQTPAEICSGDELALTASSTPLSGMSENGNVLFYELTLTDGVGAAPGAPITTFVSAAYVDANGLNDAFGFPDPALEEAFVNASTTVNDDISFSVRPYYESNPDDPFGTESCGEVMSGFGTNGFDAADWNTDRTTDAGSVEFTATTMTLTLIDTESDGVPGNGGDDDDFDRAEARYTITGTGELSFDYQLDLGDNNGGTNYDVFVVRFDGELVLRTGIDDATGTINVNTVPGDVVIIRVRDNLDNAQAADSEAVISNLSFTPACQPCPGDAVTVDFTILPALFADFSSVPTRVCEGDNAEICITGTPDATVTVFLGNGIFNDVKLDGNGNGCITTLGGLFADTEFIILGLTTLDDMPQCSFSYEGEGPVATVLVTPTPKATISLDPTTVCSGDDAVATVTGDANAEVLYSINGGTPQSVTLDVGGEGEIDLTPDAVNNGTSNIDVVVTLISSTVTLDGVACVGMLDGSVTLTVRPLPMGTISAGPAVCAGEDGTLFFTADPDVLDDYTITVLDPNGDEQVLTGTSGGAFLTTDVSGTYTLISITDGVGTDIGCTKTGEFGTAEIIIETTPKLTAAITGTVGTANLNSESPVFNSFRGLVCDEGTINVAFASITEDAQALGELMIEVQVVVNDDDQVNVGAVGTRVITFDELNTTNFLDGVLNNVADIDITSIEVVLTPFFENGADAGALEVEDCKGGTLSFFIDITPAVMLSIDADKSTLVRCEGDAVSIALTGTPGAEVSFTSTNIDLDAGLEDGTIVLDETGVATITGTAGTAGTASVTIDMVMVTALNNLGNISRHCMLMNPDQVTILINPNPTATISVEPAGPICNGDEVDVIVTLGEEQPDGIYVVIVNGHEYTLTFVGGTAVAINDVALTEDTQFDLTLITNSATGCDTEYSEVSAEVEVELVPNGDVLATGDDSGSTEAGDLNLSICANETIDLEVVTDLPDPKNDEADFYVSVDYSGSPIDFYGIGTAPGTFAFSLADFESTFSTTYSMISGSPITITLDVTYYIEDDFAEENDTEDSDGDCIGTTDRITITINPNPKTDDVTAMTCSGVALAYDLDQAITNGVVGATYSYTVASDDVAVAGLHRTMASSDPITDSFDNFSGGDYIVTYTVTPFGAEGCQGNDFELVVTVKPEPVISDELDEEVCSGDDIGVDIELAPALTGETTYELVSIMADFSADFVADAGNVASGTTSTDSDFLAADVYTNTSSNEVVVTYTVRATSGALCVGATQEIEVTVYPIPVVDVADLSLTICSGGTLDFDIVDSLFANKVGTVITGRRFIASSIDASDIRIYDFNAGGSQQTFAPVSGAFEAATPEFFTQTLNDSLVNDGTSDLVVFYVFNVANLEDDCEEVVTAILEVTVVEEADVSLNLIDGQSAICDGSPITLVANTDDGTGVFEFTYDVFSAGAGVTVTLTPSAAGGEVEVDGMGTGNAVIRVTATNDLGCIAEGFRTVSVSDTPEELAIQGPDAPCIGVTNFYDVANNPTSTYVWSISNPAAAQFIPDNTTASVDIVFNSNAGFGPFILSVTETNAAGCSTISELEVTLTDETFADFTFEVADREVSFMEEAGGSIMGYEWSYDDGTGPVVFSNDANPVFDFPGTAESFAVTLDVVGMCAAAANGIASITKTVSLDPNAVEDVIELKRGTNFISFDVAFADRSPSSVFAGVQGLTSVSSFEAGSAKLYDPNRPPFASNLREIKDDYGYVVVVDRDQTFTVTGLPISPTYQRPLESGINYIGHCSPTSATSQDRLMAMENDGDLIVARTFGRNVTPNNQLYIPGRPSFAQSLRFFLNGVGYAIITNDDVSGTARGKNETESYNFVFGTVQADDFVPGDKVEILNGQGSVVGYITTNLDGTFAATPLYGKMERPDGNTDGVFEMDDAVSFRYHGKTIENAATFNGDFNGQQIELDFSSTEVPTGLELLTTSVFPNPAGEQATVTLTTSKAMTAEVVAMDANGRVVKVLLPEQLLPAGTTRLDWNGIGTLPPGIYQVVVTSEGSILPEATKRVVKR